MSQLTGKHADPSTRVVLGSVLLALLVSLGGGYVLVVYVLTHEMSELLSSWESELWVSLRIAVSAVAFALVLGTAAGYALAKGRFPGRDLLEAVGSLPLILPPTVVGYYLIHTLSVGTTSGRIAEFFLGGPSNFHMRGCIVVGVVSGFPFVMRAARLGISQVDSRIEQAARAMGLPEWRVALQVTLPAARRSLLIGLTLAFARAMGEYGATRMVGGTIPGTTRTMSVSITEAHSPAERNALLFLLVAMALLTMVSLAWLERPNRERGD